jgi:hypothetical protein
MITLSSAIVVTAITVAATVGLFALVGPIVRTALRTGRWLGQGVVYDRVTTPVRFRLALGSFLFLLAAFAFLSLFTSYWLVVMLTG